MNADQSGFVYEFTSTRTLSHVGEKTTRIVAHNINKTTHSFTIMPIVTLDGRLLSPLYICLQEISGNELGPIVGETVKEFTGTSRVETAVSRNFVPVPWIK